MGEIKSQVGWLVGVEKRKIKIVLWGLIAFSISLSVTAILTGSFSSGLMAAVIMRTLKTVALYKFDKFFDETFWPNWGGE